MWNALLLVNIALAFYSAGAAWLAQVNWQLWRFVSPGHFTEYHAAWWRSVWWAIFPVAAASLLGICAQLVWRPPVPVGLLWLALAIQIVAYAGTAFWWGPRQAKLKQVLLADATLDRDYLTLIRTNWIRVALFTLAGFLELWLALLSFRR
ncbi:MAG TPA: hypothetical protein VHX36_03820 [Candidatus Acidoferrales bacterium]|jgi:hypothetical protein|nr:hypothetical protein [Candidatus Acidoferrales bacterium]